MRTAFLHVGLHKTGSSSLQEFMRTHASLLAQHGLEVPAHKGERRYFHRNLALELGDVPGFDPAQGSFDDLARIIRGTTGNVFVSHEIFSTRIPRKTCLDQLVSFFADQGCRLHIIAYARNFPEYLNSRYTQATKRLFNHESFATWMESTLGDPHHDLDHVFGLALNHPGVDVTIKHFDTCVATGLEWSLLDTVLGGSYDRSRFVIGERVNESLHPWAIYISRLVAKEVQLFGSGDKRGLPAIRRIRRLAEKRGWTETKFCGVSEPLAVRIQEFYREKNDAFARRVWGTPWPATRSRTYVSNEFDPSTEPPERVAELNALARDVLERSRLDNLDQERPPARGRKNAKVSSMKTPLLTP